MYRLYLQDCGERLGLEMESLALETSLALEEGVCPILIEDGTGGAYYLRSPGHRISAVFKPTDEEPYALNNPKSFVKSAHGTVGIRNGVPIGKAALRECAAYLLDVDAGVPKTTMAVAHHPKFHVAEQVEEDVVPKTGSLQEYQRHDCTVEDIGCAKFRVDAVHAIGMLDVRLCNQDRHSGNILVRFQNEEEDGNRSRAFSDPQTSSPRKDQEVTLIPIDHGCCLPLYDAMDETCFVWMNWKQADEPFSDDELTQINRMDSWKDAELLNEVLHPNLEKEAMLTLHIGTMLLQKCAAYGFSLFDIGQVMCRDRIDDPSTLEKLITATTVKVGKDANAKDFINTFAIQVDQMLQEHQFKRKTSRRRSA